MDILTKTLQQFLPDDDSIFVLNKDGTIIYQVYDGGNEYYDVVTFNTIRELEKYFSKEI